MVLGGTRFALEIVKAAKRLGIYTVVTDWNTIEQAPAKRIADKYYSVSIADVEGLLSLIKAEHIDGIMTGFADSHLKYYCDICNAAGLPCYGTAEQFDILTDKQRYKKLCTAYHVPTIDEYDVARLQDATYVKTSVQFPVLIKPSDNSGARGISICNSAQELEKACDKALQFSANKKILVERYIKGREATAFYVMHNGEIYFIGLADRYLSQANADCIGLPVAYAFPSVYAEHYYKNERVQTEAMLRGMGLQNGMLFLQCLIEDGVCHVYDIGFRLTGSLEYYLTQHAAGFNHMDMMIHYALTGRMWEPEFDTALLDYHKLQSVYNLTVLAKPGVIGRVSGIAEMEAIPGVIAVVPALLEGDKIEPHYAGTLLQVVLRVFCHADTPDALAQILREIKSVYHVEDTEGNDMLLPMFDAAELKGGHHNG